ncbi:MAG: hypothetical protein FWD57_14755, partial [Polyangiaceae bacterium]|nr:hypothetical protein [Polyangiaceae bacterium]
TMKVPASAQVAFAKESFMFAVVFLIDDPLTVKIGTITSTFCSSFAPYGRTPDDNSRCGRRITNGTITHERTCGPFKAVVSLDRCIRKVATQAHWELVMRNHVLIVCIGAEWVADIRTV